MCEGVLEFYSQFGISSTILRVGNVYGSPIMRTTTQGVIEVFVQKALKGECATIWGDALTNVRDYIFMDDFSEAVAKIGACKAKGVEVYNLSSGVGTTLEDIINAINSYVCKPLKVKHIQSDVTGAIKRIVLDMSKFRKKTGWEPKYDLPMLVKEMVASDLELAKKEKTLKENGYRVLIPQEA